MNNSYDVYMCRLKKPATRVAINNYAPLGDPSYEPPRSPFDRMPSKLEMDGMMAIFKREYCFGDKDE